MDMTWMDLISKVLRSPLFWVILVAVFIIWCVSWFIRTANRLVRMRTKVDELDADIDVALMRRFDQLTKEYQLMKQYCSHESQTLIETIRMRRGMSLEERNTAAQQMETLAAQLQMTLEAYPQLRAVEVVTTVQRSVTDTEAHLQAARRLYNNSVGAYNNACQEFPSSFVASLTGHHPRTFFAAEERKRQDVDFSV